MEARIVIENYEGINNCPERYQDWTKLGLHRNMNTMLAMPTRGKVWAGACFALCNLQNPPNSMVAKIRAEGFEVGVAYNNLIKEILSNHPKFNYLLTFEEDNTPPPYGLLLLMDSIQKYDAVSGLYWLKGEGQPPQIWGDPKEPDTYIPQPPQKDTVQECNGLGMGFTLFRSDMFKNPGFEYGQWFKTTCENGAYMTQDLYFFQRAAKLGYKFAVDTRVRVGHIDENGVIW